MPSITIFGGGLCAKAHIQSLSRISHCKNLRINVYTKNKNFLRSIPTNCFNSFDIDTPDNYKSSDFTDIILIANKSSDHAKTWKLVHDTHGSAKIIIEKPFAASLASDKLQVNFASSNSHVLFQKRLICLNGIKNNRLLKDSLESESSDITTIKTSLVKRKKDLNLLIAHYKNMPLKQIIMIHFCIHELDLIEFCSNSRISSLNSDLSIINIGEIFASVEGKLYGYLQNGSSFLIKYDKSFKKLPEIHCPDSLNTHWQERQSVNSKEECYTNMSEIRDDFWEQVICGSRYPLRRLTSCISFERFIMQDKLLQKGMYI